MKSSSVSNWKLLSKVLAEMHERIGLSVVNKQGQPVTEGKLINLTKEEATFTKSGGSLRPKEIRKWLWTYRKNRSFSRNNLVIWSSYMKEENKTYMGVGVIVPEKVASRFPEEQKVEL
tara:strand:+ start:1110 stop:1463 length:354 start_codon:yes stop_codon:yes gene_type:complete